MDYQDLVEVYTVKDATKAEIIKNALESEGITCRLDGENQAGLAGIFDIRIMVRAGDRDRAHKLIRSHEHDHE